MKELTRAEEDLMQVLWRLKKAFVKEILAELPDPKPAYNTVSTIIRILEKKGLVGYNAFGKAHQYYPLISKEDYKNKLSKNLIENYFGGSVSNLVSFFAKKEQMSLEDFNEIIAQLKSKSDGTDTE